MSKHHQHIKEVLKCLYKAGLYAKAEKCEFYSESVEYLRYILSPSGLIMSNNKESKIHSFSFWPHHVQQQSEDYSRLARAQESQEYPILLMFH